MRSVGPNGLDCDPIGDVEGFEIEVEAVSEVDAVLRVHVGGG